ncbi:hypothetical protein LY78DRAFT_18751 [Colletotrichum sublineola]|nr:hypothetical protein LY78DRAFT_18751 [Colletotrichum sublineola]
MRPKTDGRPNRNQVIGSQNLATGIRSSTLSALFGFLLIGAPVNVSTACHMISVVCSGWLKNGEWLVWSSLCSTLPPISLAIPTCILCTITGSPRSCVVPMYHTGTSSHPEYAY